MLNIVRWIKDIKTAVKVANYKILDFLPNYAIPGYT